MKSILGSVQVLQKHFREGAGNQEWKLFNLYKRNFIKY